MVVNSTTVKSLLLMINYLVPTYVYVNFVKMEYQVDLIVNNLLPCTFILFHVWSDFRF